MGRRVRAGQRVDIAFLKSLMKRRKYAMGVGAIAVFSVLIGVDIRLKCAANMDRLVTKRNQIEVRA
jgi:hypothetical protein